MPCSTWPADAAWAREDLRFGAGLAAGGLLLLLLTGITVGPGAWLEFADNSRTHLGTESVNRVGLRPLSAFGPESRLAETVEPRRFDAFARWRTARDAAFQSRMAGHALLVAGALGLLIWALRRSGGWPRAGLGLAALPFLIPLGSYYYACLTGLACLSARQRDLGAALLLLATASWWVGRWGGPDRDAVSALWSVLILCLCTWTTLRVAARPEE